MAQPATAQSLTTSSGHPGVEKQQEIENAAIKSRKELKELFKNGSLPDQNSFGCLIDSLAHRNDVWERKPEEGKGGTHRISALNRAWYLYVDSQNNLVVAESDSVRLRINANDRVEIGGPDAAFALQVNGWTGMAMRVGTYSPAGEVRKEFPPSTLAPLQVPADGRWHEIISGLASCSAFEIVASATGTAASGLHTITHATVVTGAAGGRKSIRSTFSYNGWYWRRKISLRWQANGGGRFKKGADYSLCVRTGCNFGKGDNGKPAMISYHITRMW